MKKLQNNFTTPEQSKRLLELGVPENSADCYYYDWAWFLESEHYGKQINIVQWDDFNEENRLRTNKVYPCWSVGRLAQITLICSGSSKVGMMFKTKDTDLIESFIDDIYLLKEFGRLDFSKLNDK